MTSSTIERQSNSEATTQSRKSDGDGGFRDGQLSHDKRFRWSAGWKTWIPTGREKLSSGSMEEIPPLGVGPLHPTRIHTSGCTCGACLSAGQYFSDYLKAKKCEW